MINTEQNRDNVHGLIMGPAVACRPRTESGHSRTDFVQINSLIATRDWAALGRCERGP